MKSSINVILFSTLFLFMGFNADAQRKGGAADPEDMAAKQTEHMTEKLGLTEDQVAKVEAINLAYAQKLEEARDENSGNRSAMKEIATAINKEKAAEMKMVLNEEQFKTFEEMQANQAKRRGAQKGGDKRSSSKI